MAIPIFSLAAAFKALSWQDVIVHAPMLWNGAKQLWNKVAEKETETVKSPLEEVVASQSMTLSGLSTRIDTTEARVKELEHEIVLASEIVKSLTEQNTYLVRAIDILRARATLLSWCCGSFVALTLMGLSWVAFR